MSSFIDQSFFIGTVKLPHRLIQGPLAGYSCAPFRERFHAFTAPAYCVTEMMSAYDVLYKDRPGSRFLYRSPKETLLCYQIAGHDPNIMAPAAEKLAALGADLIDINCGCPKKKIRKKGAGSALLDNPERLLTIVRAIKSRITIPLTVKLRLHGKDHSLDIIQKLAAEGVDAVIVHGRFATEDYDIPSRQEAVAALKAQVHIPIIYNGDIACVKSLEKAVTESQCDAFMVGRAGTGKPWLFEDLLHGKDRLVSMEKHIALFLQHIQGLALLENEYKAILQSKSLLRYYFKERLNKEAIAQAMQAQSLQDLSHTMMRYCEKTCII